MTLNLFLSPIEQLLVLRHGVLDLYLIADLRDKIQKSYKTDSPLLIKMGVDPTSPDLHLGHYLLLNKIRQLQVLGHRTILVIGDFTASIGDPTNRTGVRPFLRSSEIVNNAFCYMGQIFQILNFNKTVIKFNSEWYSGISIVRLVQICSEFSISQMIERSDFQKRLYKKESLRMHELLYPIMQAFDSVVLRPDIEIGGSDQLFNLFVGRNLMKNFKLPPQCIITLPILDGIHSRGENGGHGKKMSKSYQNYISFREPSNIQFSKIMSICDLLMRKYYILVFYKGDRVLGFLKFIHPKFVKLNLAFKIVSIFYKKKQSIESLLSFMNFFSIGVNVIKDRKFLFLVIKYSRIQKLLNILLFSGICESRSCVKILLNQGSILVNNTRIFNHEYIFIPGEYIVKIGKKKLLKLMVI